MNCTGEGYTLKVQATPATLAISPILPKYLGQVPTYCVATLHNPCKVPIEVVCISHDTLYIDELQHLLCFDKYRANGTFETDPRQPGDPFWPEISASATEPQSQLQAKKADAGADARHDAAGQ